MPIPFVIGNQQHCMADALNELLSQTGGKPLDIATAYFAISGYRLVKERLHQVGVFRLIMGSEPYTGVDVGLRAEIPHPRPLSRRERGVMWRARTCAGSLASSTSPSTKGECKKRNERYNSSKGDRL